MVSLNKIFNFAWTVFGHGKTPDFIGLIEYVTGTWYTEANYVALVVDYVHDFKTVTLRSDDS